MDGVSDGNSRADVITASYDSESALSGQIVLYYESEDHAGFVVGNNGAPLASGLNGAFSIDAADITGDGLLDIIVGTNDAVILIRQTSPGEYAAPQTLVDLEAGSFKAAVVKAHDVDGNNLDDLIVAWERKDGRDYEEYVIVYRNLGGPDLALFESARIITNESVRELGVQNERGDLQRLRTLDIEVGAINGSDDHPDIVVALGAADAVLWFENNASNLGTFSTGRVVSNDPAETTDNVRAVSLANLDGSLDGSLDIVIAANNSRTVAWFANDGTGTFSTANVIDGFSGAIAGPTDVVTADVDGDSLIDVVVGSRIEGIVYFSNSGDGTFAEPYIISTMDLPQETASVAVAVSDEEIDTDLDILAAANRADQFIMYRNAIVHGAVGDFDIDYQVGEIDFTIWLANHGLASGALVTQGDADRDGDVDGDDFLLWQQNYVPSVSSASPEELNLAPEDEGAGGGVTDPLTGDANLDDKVDQIDFVHWRLGFGTADSAVLSDGDFDFDGDVDGDDFLLWQANFGAAVEPPAAPLSATTTSDVAEAIQLRQDGGLSVGDAELEPQVVRTQIDTEQLFPTVPSEVSPDSPAPASDVSLARDDEGAGGGITAPLTGDANLDNKVDRIDFAHWDRGFGTADSAVLSDGDFDSDGDVDGDDFLLWQANYGAVLETPQEFLAAATAGAVAVAEVRVEKDAGQSVIEAEAEFVATQLIVVEQIKTGTRVADFRQLLPDASINVGSELLELTVTPPTTSSDSGEPGSPGEETGRPGLVLDEAFATIDQQYNSEARSNAHRSSPLRRFEADRIAIVLAQSLDSDTFARRLR